ALAVDALLALADEARAEAIGRATRLEAIEPPGDEISYLPLDADFALRNPPALAVTTPLPCDLAHAVEVEFEGHSGRLAAGAIVLSGQGVKDAAPPSVRVFPLGPIVGLPLGAIDRPGERRLRAVLTANPNLGWADP